jgi:hypothetical protein
MKVGAGPDDDSGPNEAVAASYGVMKAQYVAQGSRGHQVERVRCVSRRKIAPNKIAKD